jgi:hypothetical protein
MVRQLLSQNCIETIESSTQMINPTKNQESQIFVETSNFGQQIDFQAKVVEKIVEKVVEKPVI